MDEFLESPEWKAMRHRVRADMRRVHGNLHCECCGVEAKVGDALCVDHILPRKYYPEYALARWNLQVLCNWCNSSKGNITAKRFEYRTGRSAPTDCRPWRGNVLAKIAVILARI